MASSTPVTCPPLEQLGPANWSKVLAGLAEALASPGTNPNAVQHLQSAILALSADPAPSPTMLLLQPASCPCFQENQDR